jgi:hypothetical protein
MRQLYFLFASILLTLSAQAQQPVLRFTQTQFVHYSTSFGDSLVIEDNIYNSTIHPFTGTVFTGARVDSTPLTFPYIDSTLLTNASLDTQGISLPFQVVLHINTPLFQVGPNVVVIWPIYNGGHAGPNDSIHLVINIAPLGIEENSLARMYLYHEGGYLNLNFGEAQNLIKQVRLLDVLGKEIFANTADNARHIFTADWQHGLYFCEITTHQGERRVIKLVLQ